MSQGIPENGYQLTAPVAVHHLNGGLVAISGANNACAFLSFASEVVISFSLLPRVSIFRLLAEQRGLRIIGRTRYHTHDEMKDPVSDNFAIPDTDVKKQCLAFSQFFCWSGVTNALHQKGRHSDALIASRVDSQIRLCTRRLEALSSAYRLTMSNARLGSLLSGEHRVQGDKYGHFIGAELRSFLNELYSLRDAVLAAALRLRFECADPFTIKRIRQFACAEVSGSGKLIADSMFNDAGDLLIDRMSLYRNVAQHCLGANNPLMSDLYKLVISKGPLGDVPYLVYPLYDDIEKMREIERGSSKGILAKPPLDEIKRFFSLEKHLDALDFCYDCFVRLLRICEAVASEVDIMPQVLKITDDDIIEGTFTDQSGKTIRFGRDEDGKFHEKLED